MKWGIEILWSDRVFVGVSIMIAIGLLWMRYLIDKFSIWIALVISLAIIGILLRPVLRKTKT